MTATRSQVRPVLEPLVTLHREIYPKADVATLQRAYDVAEERHAGQKRKSGESVRRRTAGGGDDPRTDLGMDTTTLVADALLRDAVEDTGYSLEELE